MSGSAEGWTHLSDGLGRTHAAWIPASKVCAKPAVRPGALCLARAPRLPSQPARARSRWAARAALVTELMVSPRQAQEHTRGARASGDLHFRGKHTLHITSVPARGGGRRYRGLTFGDRRTVCWATYVSAHGLAAGKANMRARRAIPRAQRDGLAVGGACRLAPRHVKWAAGCWLSRPRRRRSRCSVFVCLDGRCRCAAVSLPL